MEFIQPVLDRRIQMLEMDIDPNVILSEQEFAQYVQDDWGWRKQWTTTNSVYLSKSSK